MLLMDQLLRGRAKSVKRFNVGQALAPRFRSRPNGAGHINIDTHLSHC